MSYQIARSFSKRIVSIAAAAALLLLAGCAATPEPAPPFEPPVYPPAPAEPRFIFERTLLYNDDIEEMTRAQRFRLLATGEARVSTGMVKPFDIAVQKGKVYVSDSVQRAVLLFDIPGKRFSQIGTTQPGALSKPLGIDIGPNGHLFVADISALRIMEYDANGTFVRRMGSKETFTRPTDVAVSSDGTRLYVVDTGGVESETHNVIVFDLATGEAIKTIGQRGIKEGEFNLPLQITTSINGGWYIVDGGNFRVQAFNNDDSFKLAFGSIGRYPGQFARPKGIATDADGNVYVIDSAFGNVQIFNEAGELLMFMGQRSQSGIPGSYMLPSGIDIDEDGRIYIVDQFFRKVDIFRPYALGADQGHAADPIMRDD